jgi:hypothetical protein
MNLKLSDSQISLVCRELLATQPTLSGRALRVELHRRFGSVGKKDRVYAVWRSLRAERAARSQVLQGCADLEVELEEARGQITALESALFDAEQRATRSEERERAHQDRWANEIYELREEVRQLRKAASEPQRI